jgi:N-acetyl-gamma-glutamylphosphate reductase
VFGLDISKYIYFVYIGLPDAASVEAASFVEPDNDRTVIIDASTAFRVDKDWDYGFPGKDDDSAVHNKALPPVQ